MTKKKASQLLKRLLPQIIVQIVVIALTAAGSYMLMTWLIVDIAKVQVTYLAALYEVLGTLSLMIFVLVTINTGIYRKRYNEISTISDAISKVVGGDYNYRIPIDRRETMAEVYEDFNKMTAELSSVQMLRQDFINNYSHEFKTPIASINGFAELLLQRELSPKAQREYLEIIRDESSRLASLAQNTILLSKLTSQQIVVDAEKYNLGEQLRQCTIICSEHWLSKNQEFSCELPDVTFCGNRELMQHLWLNLINNAIKYTPNGGEISINLRREVDKAIVQVTDTGAGMSEDVKSHIFAPYYQGDSSRSTQGLGLGLSIAKRIVELCRGEISVESEPDKGSTFTVVLPLKN